MMSGWRYNPGLIFMQSAASGISDVITRSPFLAFSNIHLSAASKPSETRMRLTK